MEERGAERTKKPLQLDWNSILPPNKDNEEPPAVLVVSAVASSARPQSAAMDGEERNEDIRIMTDKQLGEKITRLRGILTQLSRMLPDKGEKLKANLKRHLDELERRKCEPSEKENGGFAGPLVLEEPSFTGESDDLVRSAPSSLHTPRSSFAKLFSDKLERKQPDDRITNAFEKEFSILSRCDRQKLQSKGQFSSREIHKRGSSSRKRPFQSAASLSVNENKLPQRNSDQNNQRSPLDSPSDLEEDLPTCFPKRRNVSRVRSFKGSREQNGKTVVLVDEEESENMETAAPVDLEDERLKATKIYYPSRDDPESVEICYSDIECLAPEAFLSSTIMNFYIRFLQQSRCPGARERCNYHFFNTYFYNKLNEAVQNKNDRESSFLKLRRWWKGINIFEKSYIFLPIHENLHWSLVIICIPDKEDELGPIVLHLDSLGLHLSRPIFDNIKRFVELCWSSKQLMTWHVNFGNHSC